MKGSSFKRQAYERKPLPAPTPIRRVAPTVISSSALAVPKDARHIDRHLLDMARGQPCLLQSPMCCNDPETTVACHAGGTINGKGMGRKTSDHLVVHGCHLCNHYTDAYSGATAKEKAAVFAAGHVRQVHAWQEIAASSTASARDRQSAAGALERLLMEPLAV